MHRVVGDPQIGDAGARALARLELGEKAAGIGLQRAQLVELGGVTVGDNAAVDNAGGRLVLQRLAQDRDALVRRRKVLDQLMQEIRCLTPIERRAQLGQQAEALAQAGELARAGAFQRDARGDALDVRKAAQRLVHVLRPVDQAGDGLMASLQRFAIA